MLHVITQTALHLSNCMTSSQTAEKTHAHNGANLLDTELHDAEHDVPML